MNLFSQRMLLRLYALPLRESLYLTGLVLLILISWLVTDQLGALRGGWLANIFVFICFLRAPPMLAASFWLAHLSVTWWSAASWVMIPSMVPAACWPVAPSCCWPAG